jgi:sugar phosphate isomerase/epimerase
MKQPIAIQSWCFRHFKTLPAFFEQLKACGVSATEACGLHGDFHNPAKFAEQIGAYRSAGVQIVCIGVERIHGDAAKDRAKFEFCRAAGVKNMSISFEPDVFFEGKLKVAEALAEEFDVNLGIHNHGGYDWLGNDGILKYVFSKTSKRIGVHIDTAWALDAKQNPVKWVETFGERVVGTHVKDFVFDRARKETDVIIGTGNLDLPGYMGALKKVGFSGPLVIEYEGDESNPVPALRECVGILEGLR